MTTIPKQPESDEQLFILVKSGNRRAFDIIYDRYWKKLFAYLVKAVKDQDEAEDMVQEVFVSLWQRRAAIEIHTSLSAYLFSSARLSGLKYMRNRLARQVFHQESGQLTVEEQSGFEAGFEARDLNALFDKEIERLPKKMREVFILSRKEELSHKEIAEKLAISDKTVKKQINNVIKIFHLRLPLKELIGIAIALFCD